MRYDYASIIASLTPEQRKSAPRKLVPNRNGMKVRVFDPAYLREVARASMKLSEEPAEPVRLTSRDYRLAVKAMEVPCCSIERYALRSHLMTIAAMHGVSLEDVKGSSRAVALVEARQEIMWTLRIVYRMTIPRIAGILNRDHTTVLHGVRVHQKRADGTQPTAKNTGKPICIDTVRSLQSEGRSMRWIAEHMNVGLRRLSATIARAA